MDQQQQDEPGRHTFSITLPIALYEKVRSAGKAHGIGVGAQVLEILRAWEGQGCPDFLAPPSAPDISSDEWRVLQSFRKQELGNKAFVAKFLEISMQVKLRTKEKEAQR